MKNTFKLVYLALLVAQALVLYVIESMIPVPFVTPGVKLGLANLITVIALYTLKSKSEVFTVIILRLVLAMLIAGSLSTLLYSAAGAILSFCIMVFAKEVGRDKLSIIGVSASGAVFHNVGQLIVASLVVKNAAIMLYLPVLSFSGIITGIFIGIAGNFIVMHMKKIYVFQQLR